jgi:peptidoglycan-associated lipoprotein
MRAPLIVATLALSLSVAACGKRQAPATTPPAQTGQNDPNAAAGANPDEVGLVELPGSQAAMVAAAGSDTIYFGTDKSDISADAQATLRAQAKWLVANPAVRASGERRAQAAKLFLMAQGVPENRLLTISWGKERPVANGSDESAWAQNRRAVTVVVR